MGNYHAWQHRQWVLATFNLYDNELEFIEQLLLDDIRNNSAWNQRFFVMSRHGGWTPDNVEKEVKFAMEKIFLVKRNESAWNYLRGVLEHSTDSEVATAQRSLVEAQCRELLESGCDSPYLLGFLVELLQHKLEGVKEADITERMVEEATGLCTRLATELDTIRARYWNFISETITRKFSVTE